jgi:DNA-binding SARP family transcriptional activator
VADRGVASRLGSTLGVLSLLLGMPVVLVHWAGWPLPQQWPNRQQWQQWLHQPLTGGSITGTVAVVAWLIWLMLVYALLAEVVARLRRGVRFLRRLPRLPLPTPMQGLAGGVLGAVAVTAPTTQLPAAAGLSTSDRPGVVSPGSTPDERVVADPAAGVGLPDGGWLPHPVAQAVDAAAALVWWRRRQHYQPRPFGGPDRDEVDLAPLPATVAAVQTALHDDAVPERVTLGRPPDPLVDVGDLPAGGIGLAGPGAAGAARGALVTLLLGHPREASRDQPTVVTTAADVRALLGPAVPAHHGTPGLHVAEDLPDALAVLDTLLLHPTHRAELVTLLVTAPDDPVLARRLAVLLRLGADHGLAGLVLGMWPHGTTWSVNPDGVTTGGVRLCTVGAAAAADLLTVVALRADETPHTQAGAAASATSQGTDRAERRTLRGDHGPAVRVQLLGGLAVTSGGQFVPVPRSAALQILVFLALHADGATTEQLSAAVWPHLRPHASAGRCYTAVSVLRTTLRTAAGGRDIVTRVGDRYQLDYTAVDIDADRLRRTVHQAATALLPAERDILLRTVVDLYRGELAAGQPWPWLAPHRESIRRQVIDAYVSLATDHPDEAVDLVQKAVRVDPVNEHLYQQAVHALAAVGDHTTIAALRDSLDRHLAAAGLQALPPRPTDPVNRAQSADQGL